MLDKMNHLLSEALLKLSDLAKIFNGWFQWPDMSFDWNRNIIFGLFFGVAILIIAFGLGKSRMAAVVISTYTAAFVETVFPFRAAVHDILKQLTGLNDVFWARGLVFLVVLALALAIINRSVLKPRLIFRRASVLAMIILSLIETGFLINVFISYGALESTGFKMPFFLAGYFGNANADFFWAVMPLLSFLLLKHKRGLVV